MKRKTTAPNGITYDSIIEMCKAYGVSYNTYKYRIIRGWSFEEALNKDKKSGTMSRKKTTAPNGITYNSINDMCVAHGILYDTYQSRLRYGWSMEKALTEEVTPRINSRYI